MLTLNHILADSCSNPDNVFDPKKDLESNQNPDGWSLYVVTLHCVEYTISARKIKDGVMRQETGEWITPPEYEIRSYTKE